MKEYKNKLTAEIETFIQQRAITKLEVLDKSQIKELAKLQQDSTEWAEFKRQQQEKMQLEVEKFKPKNWLESAASRAKQISLTTHSPKYTHSDSKGNGALVGSNTDSELNYLTTESIEKPELDVIGNAAALDIAGLLKLSAGEQSLYEALVNDDYSPFLRFAESEQQAQQWLSGFKQALSPSDIASHALAKQLYFPVDNDYHLISPLFASSLYQQVHDSIEHAMFSEEQKQAREARNNNEYSDTAIVSFPELAVQSFGGTKPQNISQLNTKRYGKAYLVNCSPPKWQLQLRLPTESKTAFWNVYSDRAWKKARTLKDFLTSKLKQPSIKVIRDVRTDLIDELIDLLISTAAEIQNAKDKAGWSESSKLPYAEQLWLDPYRGMDSKEDNVFQKDREANDWQAEIAKSFGVWLNRRLRLGDKLNVGDGEYNEWRRIVNKKLTRLKLDLEDFS